MQVQRETPTTETRGTTEVTSTDSLKAALRGEDLATQEQVLTPREHMLTTDFVAPRKHCGPHVRWRDRLAWMDFARPRPEPIPDPTRDPTAEAAPAPSIDDVLDGLHAPLTDVLANASPDVTVTHPVDLGAAYTQSASPALASAGYPEVAITSSPELAAIEYRSLALTVSTTDVPQGFSSVSCLLNIFGVDTARQGTPEACDALREEVRIAGEAALGRIFKEAMATVSDALPLREWALAMREACNLRMERAPELTGFGRLGISTDEILGRPAVRTVANAAGSDLSASDARQVEPKFGPEFMVSILGQERLVAAQPLMLFGVPPEDTVDLSNDPIIVGAARLSLGKALSELGPLLSKNVSAAAYIAASARVQKQVNTLMSLAASEVGYRFIGLTDILCYDPSVHAAWRPLDMFVDGIAHDHQEHGAKPNDQLVDALDGDGSFTLGMSTSHRQLAGEDHYQGEKHGIHTASLAEKLKDGGDLGESTEEVRTDDGGAEAFSSQTAQIVTLAAREGPVRKAERGRRSINVGIDNYRTQRVLKGCINDATTLAGIYAGRGYETEVLADVETGVMRSAYRETLGRAAPGDDLFFSFSGHGGGASSGMIGIEGGELPWNEAAKYAGAAITRGVHLEMSIDACHAGNAARHLENLARGKGPSGAVGTREEGLRALTSMLADLETHLSNGMFGKQPSWLAQRLAEVTGPFEDLTGQPAPVLPNPLTFAAAYVWLSRARTTLVSARRELALKESA